MVGFRVGEKIVYPNHGVSVVEKIGEGFATEPAKPRSFYHLRLLSNNSKVMVPIGNTDLIGLRRLTLRKDITGLMKRLADYRFSASGDWKGRYKQNLDKMKSGRLYDIADVLKTLPHALREHGGELAIESAEGKGLTLTIRLPFKDQRVRMLEAGKREGMADQE